MVRNRSRNRPMPINWDNEPDLEPCIKLKPGDLVRPNVCLHTSNEEYEKIKVARRAYVEEDFRTEDGRPTFDGITQGVYLGQKRLVAPRDIKTGDHWSAKHVAKGMMQLFHIFVFGDHRVIIDLKYIERVV